MTPKSIAYALKQLQRYSMSTAGGINPASNGAFVKYADLEAILKGLDEFNQQDLTPPPNWEICNCGVPDVQNKDGNYECPECGTVKPF